MKWLSRLLTDLAMWWLRKAKIVVVRGLVLTPGVGIRWHRKGHWVIQPVEPTEPLVIVPPGDFGAIRFHNNILLCDEENRRVFFQADTPDGPLNLDKGFGGNG